MKILDTFVPGLFTFKYENESKDELSRLFDLWNDPEYLRLFFENNKSDLVYFKEDYDSAIAKTIYENEELEEILYELVQSNTFRLDHFFRNLENQEYRVISLSKQKAKKYWLRLYALKIDQNYYVITGGAIKLTKTMQERPHTDKELKQLEKCKIFLQNNNIFDQESFKEFRTDEQ